MITTCKYCQKEFRKESTLVAHLCESKRRWQQEKDVGVQLGMRAYLRFYELSQGSAKLKSYGDFVNSSYYIAFVKFGRYMVDIRAVNAAKFTDWLLKNNKKLDHWCKETLYLEWLADYIKREPVQDALERALKEMQEYADTSQPLAGDFSYYFLHGNSNRICHHISSGRVSPWIVFNCDSGVNFLAELTEEHVAMIMPWIDPTFWNKKFQDYLADSLWVKDILKQAGL